MSQTIQNSHESFNFIFDAPSFSEFLPNKDITYYNPLECSINQDNQLDAWFLSHHEDHFVEPNKPKTKNKQTVHDMIGNKDYSNSRSKGDKLPKTRKRKQISTDEYKDGLKSDQAEQSIQKKASKPVWKINSQPKKSSLSIFDPRRQLKTISEVNNKQLPKNLSTDKRVTRSDTNLKSQNASLASIKNSTNNNNNNKNNNNKNNSNNNNNNNNNGRFIKTDQLIDEGLINKNKKMIDEEEERIKMNDVNLSQNKNSNNIFQRIDNQGDDDTVKVEMNERNNILLIQQGSIDQNNQSDSNSLTNIQQYEQICNSTKKSVDTAIQNKLNTIMLSNRKQATPLKHKTVEKDRVSREQLTKSQPKLQEKESCFETKVMFDKAPISIDQQANQTVTTPPNKSLMSEDNIVNNTCTPLLMNSSKVLNNQIVENQCIANNLKSQGRVRQNKIKPIEAQTIESPDNENDKPIRHKSLNFSQSRKSTLSQQKLIDNSNKRRSELPNLIRSKTVLEERINSNLIQKFEKNWEKQNGVKLYMLDYQKRKEIRQLFQEQMH